MNEGATCQEEAGLDGNIYGLCFGHVALSHRGGCEFAAWGTGWARTEVWEANGGGLCTRLSQVGTEIQKRWGDLGTVQ